MISPEILKKVKRIEITTRHLVNTVLQGEYLSSFKGRGVEFDEVREYSEGDDVRMIDWNVTARMNAPFVKTFVEERELQVVFASDLSASLDFGSLNSLKSELMFEFTAALGFTAVLNGDRAGFFGFTSQTEKYIPPKKGRRHIMRIIREILYGTRKNRTTDIGAALLHINNMLKKRSTIFLISDFFSTADFSEQLKMIRHRHDVIAVILRDRRDYETPDLGLVYFNDPETGECAPANTSSASFRERAGKNTASVDSKLEKLFKKTGTDYIYLKCGEPYIKNLTAFFKKREKRLAR